MIGIAFSLSFALLLLIQVAVTDLILLIRETAREVNAIVGHDTLIYPDHTP